jgi:ligand-binding sensor domain-containing protein
MKPFQSLKSFIIFITLLATWNNTLAQNRSMFFREFSKSAGLSDVHINTMLQDEQGFLWIGTWNGLNRYDGNTFKVYRSVENDSTTLISDGILKLAEDKNGRIWIICHNGLSMYDKNKDRFVRICLNDFAAGNYFTSLLVDSKGMLWIGTYNGGLWALRVNDSTDFSTTKPQFKEYKHDSTILKSISTNFIYHIFEDRESNVWINASNKIIDRYNPQTDNFDHYSINIPGIEKQTIFLALHSEDSGGLFWLGSSGAGLISWDKEHNVFKQYLQQPGKNSLSANIVTHVHQEKDGILWISTDGGGISIYNKQTGVFDYCKNETSNPISLSSNAISLTFKDKSGVIWIGTSNMGLNKFEATNTNFKLYKPIPFDKKSLSSKSVSSILEDKDGNYWIGTDGGGLNFWDKKTQNFRHFRHDLSNPNSLSSDVVVSLAEDFEGNIWVGTFTKGLNCYKRKEDKFLHYTHIPGDQYSLSHNNVWALLEDNKHNLWIGTLEGTLNLFDRKTHRFYSYKNVPNDPGSFVEIYTTDLFEDSRHYLWIATSAGLEMVKLDDYDFSKPAPKLHFNHYRHRNNINSISTNNIFCIYEDHEGNMWFGTNSGGLNKLNIKTNEFTVFTEKDGLPHNSIKGILEDNDHTIWISTENGISKFDPRTKTFRNYDASDGLQDYFFSKANCKSKDGRLFFGGPNGFNVFSPKSLTTNTTPPQLVITDFKIYNGSVAVGQIINGNIVLTNSITVSKVLSLSYKENFFSFDFSALDFTNPEKNSFAYKMEGFDKDWIYSGNKRGATYTNLDPGEYIFRVKGSNNDGIWNETGTSIQIIITPPFWKTWWFSGLVILAIGGTGFGAYRMRVWRLVMREKMLKTYVEEAMARIKVLNGLIPICAQCKKIRDDKGYWNQLEEYINEHSEATFSHGVCPECAEKLYGGYLTKMKKQKEIDSSSPPPDSPKEKNPDSGNSNTGPGNSPPR